MYKYLALRDLRLQGGVPARPHLAIINTNGHTATASIFHQINAVAQHASGKINTMFILCHGFAGYDPIARISIDAGGMGLQLGHDNVLHSNVFRWQAIERKIQNIVVYACAAASTRPNNVGTTADGKYLMGALAIHTGAVVYGADLIQWYTTHGGTPHGAFEFGEWEGNLWQFLPNGNPPTKVFGVPVEFSDVVGGAAP